MKDFWNERYAEEGFAYGVEPNDFLKDNFLHFPKDGKILCLSEGEGRNALFLAKNGFEVTAVDISEVGLKKAMIRAKEENLSLKTILSDLETFGFGNETWDGIISIFGHLPPKIRQRVHQNIYPSLKTNGVFLFEAYTPEQLLFKTGGPKDESMFLTKTIIESELSELNPVIFRTCVREIQEGKYHSGLSAVVQFLGKKY